ncbi:hypothetical protein CRM22_007984 [Opisthorchis felineus]|uniref:Snake toxin/toxin-like domain-containing protein n=1 Tax=Opisthorchis felineus TaxID=147828 RepID=A0A4S2LDN6_OPIFE|nr:hypothetical protein CRM22_007984 [Opisthorchis felineus]
MVRTMKMQHLLSGLLVFVLSACFKQAFGLQCYVCNPCEEPVNVTSLKVEQNCQWCVKQTIWFHAGPEVHQRMCSKDCPTIPAGISNARFEKYCCQKDLCNASIRRAKTSKLSVIQATVVAFLMYTF